MDAVEAPSTSVSCKVEERWFAKFVRIDQSRTVVALGPSPEEEPVAADSGTGAAATAGAWPVIEEPIGNINSTAARVRTGLVARRCSGMQRLPARLTTLPLSRFGRGESSSTNPCTCAYMYSIFNARRSICYRRQMNTFFTELPASTGSALRAITEL